MTARGQGDRARAVARAIATRAWAEHERYRPTLTSIQSAVYQVLAVCRDPDLPSVILADVADNPGGGGSGNTMWLLEALYRAEATNVLFGVINYPALAAEAQALARASPGRQTGTSGPGSAVPRPTTLTAFLSECSR